MRDGAGIPAKEFAWAVGALAAIYRIPFDPALLLKQLAPPFGYDSLLAAARALGLQSSESHAPSGPAATPAIVLIAKPFGQYNDAGIPASADDAAARGPAGVEMQAQPAGAGSVGDEDKLSVQIALILCTEAGQAHYFFPQDTAPRIEPLADLLAHAVGPLVHFGKAPAPVTDPDVRRADRRAFGFAWFIPELLKHKRLWRDVLLGSLIIQILALATPIFTQVIIDKVVVHRTVNTLFVLAAALFGSMLFSAVLSWIRQYLVLHTGTRVDAVLGSRVFDHLVCLPPRYFEQRTTGVLVARMHGVESIREFVSSAAVTLLLDLPFVFVFLAIMVAYSWQLTLVALAFLTAIVALSLAVVPGLRRRLNQQFQLGARNQSFLTEYVSGMETVKSLQMEPILKQRYGEYLASYLSSSFSTRQLSNTYGTAANTLEQLMTLTILCLGAWLVMRGESFTVGMLVAFQMFAGRLSQPMLRLVGLWQELQQAVISVRRLGDIMDAPMEPYSFTPSREATHAGRVEILDLSFRYAPNLPWLYQHFDLTVEPGTCVALMGASGSGKSTLAKLLQGFCIPESGSIRIDGYDIAHLSANELRAHFGVVPQDTTLFAGTIHDNLALANPHATFKQVVQACKLAEIHGVIEQLPQGYQTEIGEHGAGLSGGQKQRIAIARALLKRPRILIFDEATSHLDQETAEQFARTLVGLRGRVSMLFIGHQLPKGLAVDRVVRLSAEGAQTVDVHERRRVQRERMAVSSDAPAPRGAASSFTRE